MWDFLDPVLGSAGDAQVPQKSPKSVGEDQRFSPEGLHLVSILVHLLGFGIARGRVFFVGLVFCVMVPRLLLLLSRESRVVGISGTTSSISIGSSSGDASCGMSGWDS
jgi:hypothetical protein